MTKFDVTSILRGLESEDVDSIRRVMNAIMHRLAGVPAATAAEMSELDIAEHASMIWIYESTRNNDILERMVSRFASARFCSANTVHKAARELDLVATEAVLNPDSRPQRELVIGEGFFNQLFKNSYASYDRGADNEYKEIEPDSDEEGRNRNVSRNVTRSSDAAINPGKRLQMGFSLSEDENLDEQETSSNVKDEESKDDRYLKESARRNKDPGKKKHQAKRKHGERCIPDEKIDRDNAVVGRYNPSKLYIELQTERPDPYHPGIFIPANPVRFDYPNTVNWDDKGSIHKLNNWRLQVFKRTLGQKRDSRPPWTIREQNRLLELLQSHLKAHKTRGRYSRINWSEIEQNFNSFFAEKPHRKGEKTAETSYNIQGKGMIAKSRKLVHDRPHVPRSAGAIENQLLHFTHPLAKKLVHAARKADNGGDDMPSRNGTDKSKAPNKKGKPKPKKVVKVEGEEGGLEGVVIAIRRENDRKHHDGKTGGESFKTN